VNFGHLLRTLRLSAGIGLRQLSRSIDVSPTYLSLIENGKQPLPTAGRIAQIEKALEVPAGYLLSVTGGLKSDVTSFAQELPEVMDFLNMATKNSMTSADFMELTGFLNAYGWKRLKGALETCAPQYLEPSSKSDLHTIGRPYIWPFLTEKLIFDVPAAEGKAKFLEYAAHRIADQCEGVKFETMITELLERERISSTGIGDGVAIPHAYVAGLDRMIVAFVRVPDGLEFDSIDKKPVYIAVFLAGPRFSENLHLKLLARLAKLLSKGSFSKSVLEAAGPREIISQFRAAEMRIP